MTAAPARQDIARLARHRGGATRATRFLLRQSRTRPMSFAQLCAAPRWPVLDEDGQTWVGAVALLLDGRAMLAREIDGARLRAYGAIVGDLTLEKILAEGDNGRDPLPPAQMLADAARMLVRAAETLDGSDAANRLARAETFLREARAWPST